MVKRLAIIPARSGSKRIVNKNIRNFCGQPMISHILMAARASNLFDEIHISTDCDMIANIVNELGFKILFKRPSNLADDFTPIMPVLRYVREKYLELGESYDQIWSLFSCAPMVMASDLIKASQLFEQTGGINPVLSVSEYPAPIEWAYNLSFDGLLRPLQPELMVIRSQDLKKKYFDAGAFVIYPGEIFNSSEGLYNMNNFIGYIMPKSRAIDIDDEEDWLIAESLFRFNKNNNSIV